MRYIYLIVLILALVQCATPTLSTIQKEPIELANFEKVIKDFKQQKEVFKNDGEWPNLDKEREEKRINGLSAIKERVENIPVQQLSETDLINRDMLQLILQEELFHHEHESILFPLNAEGGFLAGVIYSIRDSRINNEEDFIKYKKKLSSLPQYFDNRIADMRLGQKRGKSSPKLIVNNCIKLITHLLETPIEEQIFLSAVTDNESYRNEIIELLEKDVFPAYDRFNNYLSSEYIDNAPTEVGISNITDGRAYYEKLIKYFSTFDITPQEVFDTGMREVARIKTEMETIIDRLEFEGDFDDFLHFLRTDPQFYPKSGRELLSRAAWITKEMEGKLPKYFGKMPRMPLAVKPVPDALAPNYTGGRYSPGSYRNQKSGEYWVNTYKLESRPYYVLPALSLHEGVPGHHLQIMLAAELEDLPDFRKTYISAFGEGWGLYSEYLGKEAGMYKTPYEEFGALTYEMWRACRLVVDPGMHYLGWTRDRAVEFMASNTALSMHEVNTEIDRYIGWPGQAVSYKLGELKIRELRQKTEKALGDKFDIRSFHDKLLENGSIPLKSLERVVDDYIANAK